MSSTLQALVLPNLEVRAHEEMYVRLVDGAWCDLNGGKVFFEAGSVLSTDTFFNGLSVGVWKRHCSVDHLALRFRGAGEFIATLGLHRRGQVSIWLAEHRVRMLERSACVIPVPQWKDIRDGLLFLRIRALGPAVLSAADFISEDLPLNPVRLGLVITHFNRQAQVLPAIARIRRDLLDVPALRGAITLTVVDNSRNLPLGAHPGIAHIPNRNLGGTGGFVRGLMSLIDGGGHSHALFMDDDASCETASIARALVMLQYARRPALAIAGALLRELAPWELLEKGARFDGQVRPLHAGLDMRRVADLLESEREVARVDYGAWWFFAFPLTEARTLPFPFFVRGDDIFFGLKNNFEIVTANGIACLGEDFSSKHGPMTAYLDARYHLIHALLDERRSAAGVAWVGRQLFLKALNGYLYSSAAAVTLAFEHMLLGPRFFAEHIDMQSIRGTVGALAPNEKLQPIDPTAYRLKAPRRPRESFARRLLRALTLQGFLLPGFLIRDRTALQPKSFHGPASGVFRYRRVLYEHAASGTGFVASFDRGRYFQELSAFASAWVRLRLRLPRLRRSWLRGVEEMSTVEFWREVYREEMQTEPDRRAAATARVSMD